MTKAKFDPNGFAALEGLLILIIIAVIGGIGWYSVHTKHQTDKILTQADKISQSTATSTPSNKLSSVGNNFTFKEFAVQFNPKDDLKGLAYSIQGGNAYLTDNVFLDALKQCSDYKSGDTGGGFAAISKTTGQYPKNANPIQDGALLKQFQDFWISWGIPNGNACSDLSKADAVHTAASAEAQKFYSDFQNTATQTQ